MHITPARFLTGSFVRVVVVTILSLMLILQSVTLIFGPTIPNASAAVPNFNIAAAGDWGCKTDTTSTVNNIVGKSPEVSLSLADNSYGTSADCWFSKIGPIDDQMHTAIGNHDVTSSQILAQYMNHYNMQQQYYSFNYQNIHFLVLSTETDYAVGSAQYNFASDDLQKAASDPNIGWIIVSFHRLIYASPNELNLSGSSSLRKTYHPLFQQYGVDLVLDGHLHNYERSYPLKFNNANPVSPIIESTSTSTYNDPVGQIFATVGTGGQNIHDFTGRNPEFAVQAGGLFGFLNIEMLNDGQTLKGTFYANGGSTKDQFTIQKGQSPPPPPTTTPYHYDPSLTLSGTNYQDVTSNANLQLTTFSVAAWFKTTNDYTSDAFIVNKGGSGSETATKNMNYGIWMTSAEKIRAGFETSSGTDQNAVSPASYNDGNWHYAVATYDGSSTVRLYIDGQQVATKTTSGALPDKAGTQPLRVGANSLTLNGFFTGNIDEVRVWNRAVSATGVSSQYNSGTFDTTGQVAYLPFSSTSPPPPPSNTPPTANAGPDQTVNEGSSVTLDGSGSSDSDGTIASYAWTQTAGPSVTLSNPSAQKPTFTAPQVTQDTTLTFSLVVTDDDGATSTANTVNILVKDGSATTTPYHYDPSLTLSGTNYQDVTSNANLQLTTFSVAAWFKTTNDYTSDAFIVNKGGSGSETATKNMNYGIWMTSAEKIQAGFETSTGIDYTATSPGVYNDGNWHYAVATYDGSSTVRLYIDGSSVATKTTSGATPDKGGTQPLRIGANSLSLNKFFVGNVDEVRVWNRAVSATGVSSQYNSGTFDTTGQVAYLPFSSTAVSTNSNSPSIVEMSSSPYNGGTLDTTTNGQIVYLPPSSLTSNSNPSLPVTTTTSPTANAEGNNAPPTANAGRDQTTVREGYLVTLDGSRSTDSDGTIASYAWTQTAGPSVELSDATAAQPTFIVPPVTQDTTLTFSLVVTDNNGASSAPDTVNVLVKNLPANLPPKANAGPDQTVNQNATVTLDGSASSDRDGSIEYYQWTQTSGPLVPMKEVDDHVAHQKAMFTAPNVGPNGATMVFRLTVFDSDGAAARDTVNVKVSGGGQQQNATQPITTTTADSEQNQTNQEPTADSEQNQTNQEPITTANQEPTTDAGADQTVNEGDNVKLDGSASTDPDSDTLTYAWTQTAGTTAGTLRDASSATPTFTAPDVDSAGDTLTFELTVNDGNGHTATDTVKVLVKNVPELAPAPEETTTTTTTTTTTAATSLTLNPISNVPWGSQTVTLTGKLTSADKDDGGSAISGQTITLTGTGIKEEQQQTISANTQSDGTFTATFAAPDTVATGWTVQAHYAGGDDDSSSANLQPSDSEERTFATLKHGTTLSLILDPAQVAKGGSYTVHGVLKDSVTNEFIESMTITFTADQPISIKSTTTDSSGNYQATSLKAPTNSGSYDIEAKSAENSLYDSATSGKKTLIVK